MAIASDPRADDLSDPDLTELHAKGRLPQILVGFGLTSKMVMVVLFCFFPIALSTVSGLRSAPHELIEPPRSLSVSASCDCPVGCERGHGSRLRQQVQEALN